MTEPTEEYKRKVQEVVHIIRDNFGDVGMMCDACAHILINSFHRAPSELKHYIGETIESVLINTIASHQPNNTQTRIEAFDRDIPFYA